MKKSCRKARGFTLVELMIVIGLIGVIASLAIPNYLHFSAKASRTEMLNTVGNLHLYFKNTFDNFGTMSTPSTLPAGGSSAINPPGAVGQPGIWVASASGWSDFQFPPEGGVRMRYSYTLGSIDQSGKVSDVTISACGSFAGLGPNTVTCPGPMLGNYLYTEVFHGSGTIDPPTEIPHF